MRLSRRLMFAGAVAAAGLGVSACSTDPEFWDAVATGLDQAAADLEYENAWCYWGTSPAAPTVSRRYCPGDYGYRDIYIPPESPYWRQHRGGRDHDRRGRDHDSGGHHGK